MNDIIKHMVFMSIFGYGKEYEYECYPLHVVENINDFLPIEFYKGPERKPAGLKTLFKGREAYINNYCGGDNWGVCDVYYVDDGTVKIAGIVRGGWGLETVVFVDWEFLKKL